jgi:hypothetical protein
VTGAVIDIAEALTPSREGRKFFIGNDGIPHRIATHADGSHFLTLETDYLGGTTIGSATIYQDEVSTGITDLLGFPELTAMDPFETITLTTEADLIAMAPRNTIGREQPGARMAAFLDDGTIRFAPWSPTRRLFEVSYNRRPELLTFDGTEADVPIVPRDGRVLLMDRALERLFMDKQDRRIQQGAAFTSDAYARLVSKEMGFSRSRRTVPPGLSIIGR